MSYEIFTAYGAGARDSATLRASGYLFVPKRLMQLIEGEQSQKVVLLFNKEKQEIVVRLPCDQDPPEALREVILEKSGTAINVVPLLKAYKFDLPSKKVKLPAKFDELSYWIVMDMKDVPDEIPF